MPGDHRGGLAVASALALSSLSVGFGAYVTALNQPKQERYQSYRYAPGNMEAAKAALSDKSAAPEYRKPCEQPEGENESDLCAQWKAARAAEGGALWAQIGVVVSSVGLIGLFWTLFYTREAVRAAQAATKDANEALDLARQSAEASRDAAGAMRDANNIAAASQRPWLNIENISCKVCKTQFLEDGERGISFAIEYELVNYGKSPALAVFDMVVFSSYRDIHDSYPGIYSSALVNAPMNGEMIFPSQRRLIQSAHARRGLSFARDIDAVAISVIVYTTYRGANGQAFLTGTEVCVCQLGSSQNMLQYFNLDSLPDEMTDAAIVPEPSGNVAV